MWQRLVLPQFGYVRHKTFSEEFKFRGCFLINTFFKITILKCCLNYTRIRKCFWGYFCCCFSHIEIPSLTSIKILGTEELNYNAETICCLSIHPKTQFKTWAKLLGWFKKSLHALYTVVTFEPMMQLSNSTWFRIA